ncbi:hypothetical protein [Saccharothrix obliqua]|nr:hypothetical protein [Saccharothrix obliqua]
MPLMWITVSPCHAMTAVVRIVPGSPLTAGFAVGRRPLSNG